MVNHNKIKFAIVYNRKNTLNSERKALIQIRAYQKGNGGVRFFSTGVYIKPKHWSDVKKQIKHTHPNHAILNARVASIRNELESYELMQAHLKGSFSLKKLHEYSKQKDHREESFIDFCQKYLNESTMKQESKKGYQTTINKLKTYRNDLSFDGIDYAFIDGFHRFLRKTIPNPNTAAAHHKRVKQFIKAATLYDKMGVDEDPYRKFRKHLDEKIEPNRVFINIEELMCLESLRFDDSNKHLERARDMFLFQTYTGLRYSDLYKIAEHDLSYSEEKGTLLYVESKKTSKRIFIPLRLLFKSEDSVKSRPELILDKYLPHNPSWTRLKSQPYNRSLKKIAALAGINKNLSSHAARRGFVTILHNKGVSITILKKMLQHSKIDMTQVYIQLSNKDIEDQLDNIKWSV